MCHPKWEQASSEKFYHFWCQKSKRNPKDDVECKHNCLNKNIVTSEKFTWWKNSYNPTGFYLLWKPTKMATFIPFFSSSGSDRSSCSELFLEKSVVKICSKFTGEYPCWSAIPIKLQSNFIEMALWHGCSPVNLLHIFGTPSPKNTSDNEQLLQAGWTWNLVQS